MASNKRPLSTSSRSSSSNSITHDDPATKKLKSTEGQAHGNAIFHSAKEFSDRLSTAFDLKHALTRQREIDPIGYSLTTYEKQKPPTAEQQRILEELRELYKVAPKPYKAGKFKQPFHLTITRSSCKFDGASKDLTENKLKEWFENASISGYGDNQTLETKTDPNVRDAREISSNDFSVQPELLERINSTWQAEFAYPSSVRVAPYKIHIYGPGGHFKAHRDTPEPDLIGTFLLGIGETDDTLTNSYRQGYFHIGDQTFRADIGKWVAFHPDVPHSISVLPPHHYRAVIAFKIFGNGEGQLKLAQNLQSRVEKVIHAIPRPFGILLDHSYHLGAAELNGYDAILLAGAQTCQDSVVHVLPVIVSTRSLTYYDDDYDRESYDSEADERKSIFKADIKPFLPAHIDILNKRATVAAKQAIKFLEDVSDVPFYCRDFKSSAGLWNENSEEINFTGNESDGQRESSIYLSHALLVLPTAGDGDR